MRKNCPYVITYKCNNRTWNDHIWSYVEYYNLIAILLSAKKRHCKVVFLITFQLFFSLFSTCTDRDYIREREHIRFNSNYIYPHMFLYEKYFVGASWLSILFSILVFSKNLCSRMWIAIALREIRCYAGSNSIEASPLFPHGLPLSSGEPGFPVKFAVARRVCVSIKCFVMYIPERRNTQEEAVEGTGRAGERSL